MKVQVVNQKNKKVSDADIKEFTEDGKVNENVLSQYIFIYRSNQRQGNSKVKGRAEVRGGGKKPYAQKGTGNARAGSNRSPIWKGGGITFGPTGNENWKKKTTKKFRRSAFQNALSKAFADEKVNLIDELNFAEDSLTKQAVDMIKNFADPKSLVIVTLDKNENAINAFSNIKNAKVVMASKVNPYDLIANKLVLIEQKAMDFISDKWGK